MSFEESLEALLSEQESAPTKPSLWQRAKQVLYSSRFGLLLGGLAYFSTKDPGYAAALCASGAAIGSALEAACGRLHSRARACTRFRLVELPNACPGSAPKTGVYVYLKRGAGKGEKTITVVGAIHVGHAKYYEKVQQLLDQHDAVFYEGVQEVEDATGLTGLVAHALKFTSEMGYFAYRIFCTANGLREQEDALRYRPGWHNADADLSRLAEWLPLPLKLGVLAAPMALALIFPALYAAGLCMPKTVAGPAYGLAIDLLSSARALLWPRPSYRERQALDALRAWDASNAKGRAALLYGQLHVPAFRHALTRELGYRLERAWSLEAW